MNGHTRVTTSPMELVFRVLVVAALATDAVVHLRLAGMSQEAAPGGVGEGTLFRIEAALAILVALFVAIRGSRAAYAMAFVITLSGLVAVLLYRYVNIPAFGPIPAMYEPVWFFNKSLSAVAEGIGVIAAGAGFVYARRRRVRPSTGSTRGQ